MLSVLGRATKANLSSKLRGDSLVPLVRSISHHDMKVPDFDTVRKSSKLDPATYNKAAGDGDKVFTYAMGAGAMSLGLISAKAIVHTMVGYIGPTAGDRSEAKVELNLAEIPIGDSITFVWKGLPVFIRHRTEQQILVETETDIATLRDPEHDNVRTVDPNFLVVIGVCTHLGCVPIANQGLFGGYFCPCHGSHYDYSGRIRKGPAPLNLKVPEYKITDGVLCIG